MLFIYPQPRCVLEMFLIFSACKKNFHYRIECILKVTTAQLQLIQIAGAKVFLYIVFLIVVVVTANSSATDEITVVVTDT